MADQSLLRSAAAGLTVDALYLIAHRVPCEIDRLHMSRVCHSWREALTKTKPAPPAPPPPLQWLLLPKGADGERPPTFSCAVSSCRVHPFFLPRGAHRARCFGSYDGAWLFLAVDVDKGKGQAADHVLVNLNNFKFLDLPNAIRVFAGFRRDGLESIAIVAAVLSRPPTERGCIVDLRFSPRRVAFWRMGDWVISQRFEAWAWPPEGVDDLLYHDGYFLFLTTQEHVLECPEPIFYKDGVRVDSTLQRFQPRPRPRVDGDELILARYLVRSREKLLMVVRLSSSLRDDSPSPTTSSFRVFEKEEKSLDGGGSEYSWRELKKLEGRMLFVGRGCSRCYEEDNGYPGMEGVYFLDDRSFRNRISMGFDDDPPQLQYHCSDNGKWSADAQMVRRCFFPEQDLSDYSPPVWILP
uniref:KIB1-4 beta-propeller domain-containing protein n=1 Tax=Leersia perrieri TaxID=77586 RepID=A0A0D9WJ59_9ORYZ